MHLFITDFFISVDMLAQIISLLKKNKLKVGVLNQNIIQDFKIKDNIVFKTLYELCNKKNNRRYYK